MLTIRQDLNQPLTDSTTSVGSHPPQFGTGFAPWDRLTGGFHGTTILAGQGEMAEPLALALTISALQANPKLGAVLGGLGTSAYEHHLRLSAMVTGLPWKRIELRELTPDEELHYRRAWDRFLDEIGPRLRIVELPKQWSVYDPSTKPLLLMRLLAERRTLLDSGLVDNVMAVIDSLWAPAISAAAEARGPGDRYLPKLWTVDRRRIEFAMKVRQLMACQGIGTAAPVLAVGRVVYRPTAEAKMQDIRGRPAGLADVVGLIQKPPFSREGDTEYAVNLDITVGDHGRVDRLRLACEFGTRRFKEAKTGEGIGWTMGA
jgi:hypothetical protein